jgi:putative phosphoribosyl transferase
MRGDDMIEFIANTEHPVTIACEEADLNGLLHIPTSVAGLVIFAHGSGSSRLSPRNQHIAKQLQHSHFATLLFDLLTEQEDEQDTHTMEFRFDIDLLARRLLVATTWVQANPVLRKLPLGYFGASTGGAAALVAAAKQKESIKAVVSRGGRPDLAEEALTEVEAATLLIVGGEDQQVIELNKKAFATLHCVKKLEIIPGATHLFEEPGALDKVAHLADAWFKRYF